MDVGNPHVEKVNAWTRPLLLVFPKVLALHEGKSSFGGAVVNLNELNLACRRRCQASMLQTVKQIQILAKGNASKHKMWFLNKGFYY